MTTEEGNQNPPKKRRKLGSKDGSDKSNYGEPFYPFKLVPSPQEKRGLETSN
jgi:hypothetical protein